MDKALEQLLRQKAHQYNQPGFIAKDPVAIPHRFTRLQDIELSGFFAAILAWGNRTTIINSTNKLMSWMDESPYYFICHHKDTDLKPMLGFVHRTFNATDLLYFISFLQHHYLRHNSLEDAFFPGTTYTGKDTGAALIHFHNYFFSLRDFPERTRKHIATPARKSACKRLNMFLRWMVRADKMGVDFGLWRKIRPALLVCPLDVHVAQVAHRFGLLPNAQSNWQNAVALTTTLKQLNPEDPVLYDYALFGLGAEERFR